MFNALNLASKQRNPKSLYYYIPKTEK